MLTRSSRPQNRRGAVLVLFVVLLIAICAFMAMAIDIGVIAVARTQAQNAVDAAVMNGVRQLNGDQTTSNNSSAVVPAAQNAVGANYLLGQAFTATADLPSGNVYIGKYYYDTTAKKFLSYFPTNAGISDAGASATNSAAENFTTVYATLTHTGSQTYFGNVFGMTSFNSTASAQAVSRPRDVAMVVDFSGSMLFGSVFGVASDNGPFGDRVKSNNPDPNQPSFGHYSSSNVTLQSTATYYNYGSYNLEPSNWTASTSLGHNRAPICGDFYQNNAGATAQTAFTAAPTSYAASPAGDVPLKKNGNWIAAVQDLTGGTGKSTQFENLTLAGGYSATPAGYTQGPVYWGKTFWIWPPIPSGTNGTTGLSNDWRKAFFLKNDKTTPVDDNNLLFDTSGNWKTPTSGGTTNYYVNYQNILKWLTSTPNPFPPQLRSGKILYYSAIPSGTDTTLNARWWNSNGGSMLASADEQFWKDYIDWALGQYQYPGATWTSLHTGGNGGNAYAGYGADFSFTSTNTTSTAIYPKPTGMNAPYMDYRDNPMRPQTLMWFGPMSMIDFMGNYAMSTANGYQRGFMWPGVCHESVTYVCKLGLQGAILNSKNNHPNDRLCMGYYSTPEGSLNDGGRFNRIRVPMGQNYQSLQDALWYPLDYVLGNASEIRPYDNYNNASWAGNMEVPRAGGGTCYAMGFMLLYNQYSCNSTSALLNYSSTPGESGGLGRNGAQKIVILETDGFPNVTASATYVAPSSSGAQDGYYKIRYDSGNNSHIEYPTGINNGDNSAGIATQLVADYSLTRKPALIYTIAFGPVFDPSYGSSGAATALAALGNLQSIGNRPTGTYPIPQIYGTDANMQSQLTKAITNIFEAEIPVSLVK